MRIRKVLSILLVMTLVMSLNPVVAFAESDVAGMDAATDASAEQVLSSRAWFEHQGSAGAMAVLDDAETNPNIVLGGEHDATSLANMKASIQYLKECNELRAQHGLDPLLVSDAMMAIAQSQLDATRDSGNQHSLLYGVSENLGFEFTTTTSPFNSWYTREKNLLANNPNIATSKIAHYLNIIDPDAKYTGFAVIQDAGNAMYSVYYGQVFGEFIPSPARGDAIKSYTVEEFETLFLAWYTENVSVCPDCGMEYAGEHECLTYTCEICGETYKGDSHTCPTSTCPDCGKEYVGEHECQGSEPEDPQPSICPECGVEYMGEHECETGEGEEPEPSEPVDISTLNITVAEAGSYDGGMHEPAVFILDGEYSLVEGKDYAVSYPANTRRAGSYSLTITGIGGYAGNIEMPYRVSKASLRDEHVSLAYSATAYNGSAKKPAATVKVNGVSQLKGEYKVTYHKSENGPVATPKLVGTYWAKVQALGSANTAGLVWKKFVINPMATANLKLTRLNNGFKASWTKKTVQASGYQLQYRLKGKTTWTTKWMTSCKTNSKKVTGLKDKKTYQVRVRTYKTTNGVKYYSAWTSTKTVRTK